MTSVYKRVYTWFLELCTVHQIINLWSKVLLDSHLSVNNYIGLGLREFIFRSVILVGLYLMAVKKFCSAEKNTTTW